MKIILAALSVTLPIPAFADVTAAAPFSGSQIIVRTCNHDAGAICSLTWNGEQFIDDYDHGRQLQSSVTFDYQGEAFNPTEAGAWMYTDGINPRPSSSKSIYAMAVGSTIMTSTQMAYWLPVNGVKLSNHVLTKSISIGYSGMPNVIDYRVKFTIPAGERHQYAQFEYVTGYMPSKFKKFYYVGDNGVAMPLSDGPGEQTKPIILATANGSHAMGIYSRHGSTQQWSDQGYGRWRHPDCVKWNAVWRTLDPVPGAYQFQAYVVVGTLAQVTATINTLKAM